MKKLATEQIVSEEETRFPQEPLWSDTIDVIQKLATKDVVISSSQDIGKLLRFNSIETRQRYGNAIYNRLFARDIRIGNTIIEVYKTYQNIDLVITLWRCLYFSVEPIIAQTYLDIIWPREPGTIITTGDIKNYIRSTWKEYGVKILQRINMSLTQSGVIRKQGKEYVITGFANLETAFLILLHLYMVKDKNTTTISIVSIENHRFWKFLGYRSFEHVKVGLRKAEQAGWLTRYSKIDQLEQITTKYNLEELIHLKPVL